MGIEKAKQEVISSGHELVAEGLVARTWGNVSCRLSDESFVITPSGIGYDRLLASDIVEVSIADCSYEGDTKPSSEKGIHADTYAACSDVNFIIHTHQTYATCVSLAGTHVLSYTDEEEKVLGGKIGLASYAMPGTKKLRRHVQSVLRGSGVLLLERHGALITGANREEAFAKAACLESVCQRSMPLYDEAREPDIHATRGEIRAIKEGLDANKLALAEAVSEKLFRAYEGYTDIYIIATQAISEAMQSRKNIPAYLDDYAQIIGVSARVSAPEAAASALTSASAVYVQGLGVVCCGKSSSDCGAIMKLAEKNALAMALCARHGGARPIPYYERAIMRRVYVKKYSRISEMK